MIKQLKKLDLQMNGFKFN